MSEEEKETIDFFIHECEKYDGTIEIKGTSVREETRIINTVVKFLKEIPKIQALEKQHDYDMQMIDEVKGNAVKWANELEQEKEKNKKLEEENRFLKTIYRGTEEFKIIQKFANGGKE